MGLHSVTDAITTSLYEGILEPTQWMGALQTIQASLQCAAFHQLDIGCRDFSVQSIAASMAGGEAPSEKVAAFERHYAPQDIRLPAMWQFTEGAVWCDHEQLDRATLDRAPIYTEFLAELRMRHTLGIPLRDGASSRDFLGFIRHLDQPPFGSEEQTLVTSLVPHLVRANKLRYRANQLAVQAALGAAALDALPQALAVVDAGLHVRYANAAAEHVFAGQTRFTSCQGVLHASDPESQRLLEHRVAEACRSGDFARAGIVRIASSEHCGGECFVHILPLRASHPLAAALHAVPYALLVWSSTLAVKTVEHICTALGLTETEARLALMLAQGRTVKDFAQAQGCSWHTARTHAKNLLTKTGCHRQAEIVQLLQAFTWG
ncbi:PAS domain-containing protein [Acidovorax sp. LjRoot38]|uniref:helix-turn-helix transcriptional regulator n=1 Tax=Acidovorax sp. LjRoot38 TaxID=3342327 RepID=UPI003ED15B89